MSQTADGPRVVLVTGASRGIGRATAQLLSGRGYRVFGTSRAPAAPTDGLVEMLPLEVSSAESCNRCVAALLEHTGGQIDALVNNVGTGILGAAEETSAEEALRLFEVNFFGAVRLTNAVLPVMRQRGWGRVVNMSSAGGIASVPFAAFYCATKHALEGYSQSLRMEVARFGVAVSVVGPAEVSTEAGDHAMRPERPLAVYDGLRERLTAYFVKRIREGMNPAHVAAAVLDVLRSPWPAPRYAVGLSAKALSLARALLPEGVFESLVRWSLGMR